VRLRHPSILSALVAFAGFSLLAAGCGGSGSPGVASVASSTTAATTTMQAGTTTTRIGTLASALAFARCMRSHGLSNWPDPTSSGVFDKSTMRQLGYSQSRVRTLEQGACNIPLPSGGQSQGQGVTLADQADYREAAACMRAHGFPTFPDPTFQSNDVTTNIPSGIDQDSAQFKSAVATCTKLIPAGLPYSSSAAR
jgi:hypothetical protein